MAVLQTSTAERLNAGRCVIWCEQRRGSLWRLILSVIMTGLRCDRPSFNRRCQVRTAHRSFQPCSSNLPFLNTSAAPKPQTSLRSVFVSSFVCCDAPFGPNATLSNFRRLSPRLPRRDGGKSERRPTIVPGVRNLAIHLTHHLRPCLLSRLHYPSVPLRPRYPAAQRAHSRAQPVHMTVLAPTPPLQPHPLPPPTHGQ